MKTLAEWIHVKGVARGALLESTGLDERVLEAILQQRYTPSPEQRRRLAMAVGQCPEDIAWGHAAQVSHIHGHGPQFGRSP